MGDFTMAPAALPRYFEPTAATASMFLYAQGPSVVCCHHDTLTIERRFARHSHEVQLLAVDNHSEVGAGRFVVSYDAGQNAIVWDLMTGDEIARFASYEHLTAAAWMKSGNVAFGESPRPPWLTRTGYLNLSNVGASQETPRGRLFYSSPPRPSMSRLGQLIRSPLPPLPRLAIVEHLQSGASS